MELSKTVSEAASNMNSAVEHFKQELAKLRTGRAHPDMLAGVVVESYGQNMPLKAVAGVSAPEPTLLQITPYDPANLQPIADAIRSNETLGLNPVDDGRVVRIQLPPLTTESRQQMAKVVGQKAEDCAISLRNVRHEAFHAGEQAEKNKQISQDERFNFEKQIDEMMNKLKSQIDEIQKTKEQEIMTI